MSATTSEPLDPADLPRCLPRLAVDRDRVAVKRLHRRDIRIGIIADAACRDVACTLEMSSGFLAQFTVSEQFDLPSSLLRIVSKPGHPFLARQQRRIER